MSETPTMGPQNVSAAVAGARAANAHRATTLYRLSTGEIDLEELLAMAQHDHTLRRMSLRTTLLAIEGIGEATARRIIDKTVRIANENNHAYKLKSITIAWLLNEKDYGRRFEALAEALCDPTTAAYPLGFPYNTVEVTNGGPLTRR